MEWLSIAGLIFLGICLVVIEVIFVPGTTIVGIAGFICLGFAVYIGYATYDTTTGTLIFIGTGVAGVGTLILALRSKAWEQFSLKDENTGHFNEDYAGDLATGDEGVTISSLKPFGKAIFHDKEIEVRSNGEYISENEPVQITKMDSGKIYVASLNLVKQSK